MTDVRIGLMEVAGRKTVKGHGRGITVFKAKTDDVYRIILEALKRVDYEGSWQEEHVENPT